MGASKTGRFSNVLLAGSMVALVGCAAIETHEAESKEQMLAAAGFQLKPADSPQKVAQLDALPQRKLLQRERDGKVYFLYADAGSCHCLYIGNEKNYDEYQKLALKQQTAEEEIMAAQLNEQAELDWGLWGPWPGY